MTAHSKNVAYQYVHNIAHLYDQGCDPSDVPQDIVHPEPQKQAVINQTHQLPTDPQHLVYNQCSNMSHWFLTTGFLGQSLADPVKEKQRQEAIEMSARHHLTKLGKPVSHWSPPSHQLLDHIFEEVVQKADPKKLEEILNQIEPLHNRVEVFKFWAQRLLYRIEGHVANILAHWAFRWAIYLGVLYIYKTKIAPPLSRYLYRHLVPLIIQKLSLHAPLPAIRVMSAGIGGVQYVLRNPLKITFGFLVSREAVSRLFPAARPYFNRVGTLLFFPDRFVRFLNNIASHLANNAWNTSAIGAEKLKQLKTKGELYYFQDQILKARQIWKDLMQKGPQEGVFLKTVS